MKADNLLSQREVTQLLDYSLAMSIMRNATENEINDVFDRINTGIDLVIKKGARLVYKINFQIWLGILPVLSGGMYLTTYCF